MAPSVLPPDRPAVVVERDHERHVSYLDAGGVQLAVDDVPGDEAAVVTVPVPLDLLRSLRALLNHPAMAALLDVPETAQPPVA